MSELPRVAIVLVTSHRLSYAIRTVQALCDNLQYSAQLAWYVGVDGDDQEHLQTLLDLLSKNEQDIFGHHAIDFVPGERLPGKSWNMAWTAAHDWSDVVLWMENDFVLTRPLNIDAYVRLLMENEKVGMVRLGLLPINLNMTSMGFNGIMYLQMWRNMQYGYSGNPHLKHRRFADAYGPYNEAIEPGETEVEFDARFRTTSGPEIWWPPALGDYGAFGHIGREQSY